MAVLFGPAVGFAADPWLNPGLNGVLLSNGDVVSGQVNALAVDPRNADVVYAGASDGGIWQTTTASGEWINLSTDGFVRERPDGTTWATLGVGAVALDPLRPDVVYVGTGNPQPAVFGQPGLGVFRRSDTGDWVALGVDFSSPECSNGALSMATIHRLLVRAVKGTTEVFAATDAGLHRFVEDGRDCWTRVTAGLPSAAVQIVTDLTGQGRVLFAAVHGQGVFRSMDGGTSWTRLTADLPAAGFENIALSVSPASGSTVYAGFNAGAYRLFRTDSLGTSWTELPSPPSQGQLSFNNALAHDPVALNTVYLGQIALWRAIDGGRDGGSNNHGNNPPVRDRSWTELSCCRGHHTNSSRAGIDLHADNHAIVFAPPGSFQPSPSVSKILYVANDGGVTRGEVNDVGVVTWQPRTQGLAISQCGTVSGVPSGLPVDALGAACGAWHSGNFLIADDGATWVPFGAGDGFGVAVDAAPSPRTVYFHENALNGGAVSRARISAGRVIPLRKEELIFAPGGDWLKADPLRPGHLLFISQATGRLVRNRTASTRPAAELNDPSAWPDIGPPQQGGRVTSFAIVRPDQPGDSPVYYLATDAGEIWRGSPEVSWEKAFDYGAAGKVTDLAVDPTNPARVLLTRAVATEFVQELVRGATGAWRAAPLLPDPVPDARFVGGTAVGVHPLDGDTVFVGTEAGLYQGARTGSRWKWERVDTVPLARVMDIEPGAGNLYLATWGRGLFILDVPFPNPFPPALPAASPKQPPGAEEQVAIAVQATEVGGDGPAASLPLTILAQTPTQPHGGGEAPYELLAPVGSIVSLEAPGEAEIGFSILRFEGWFVGDRAYSEPRLTLPLEKDTLATAYYRVTGRSPDPNAAPLTISGLRASAGQLCLPGRTHEAVITWNWSGGQAPVHTLLKILASDQSSVSIGLKPTIRTFTLPLDSPDGGQVQVDLELRDFAGDQATARTSTVLSPCSPDCNSNDVPDAVDISSGASADVNSDGSPDECEVAQDVCTFVGTAQGGAVSVSLSGFTATCTVSIATTAGQSVAIVAANLAAAINADACMSSQGITASASGSSVRMEGFLLRFQGTTITDPGIVRRISDIPTLTATGVGLMLVLILLAAFFLLPTRWRSSGSG